VVNVATCLNPHAVALLALLRGGAPALTVYDGHVPANPTFPYCVLYVGWGGERTALTADTDQFNGRAQVTSVGANAEAARIVAQRAAARLLDVVPTVAGRSCWPITLELSQPPREDRDVHINGIGYPVYVIDEYRLTSNPA
jgi:hypothetical protein